MSTLVGFGLVNVDLVSVVPSWERDHKVDATHWFEQVGGPVPVALCAASRLDPNLQPVFIGSVGDDAYGETVASELQRFGVAPRLERRMGGATGRSMVLLDARDGSRTLAHWSEPASPRKLHPEELQIVRNCRLLHVDGRDLPGTEQCLRAAKEAGVTTAWDLGTMRPGRESLFPLVDIVIASRGGGAGAFPEVADDPLEQVRRFMDRGAKIAAVTLAENGVVVGWQGRPALRVPAIPTNPVLDTCGAGDTFHGAFLAAHCAGADPVEAVDFAQAAVSLRIGRYGHRDGLPTPDEVRRLLAKVATR